MDNKIVKGKIPLASKPATSTDLVWSEGYDDFFKIDAALKAELDAQGFGYKFIRSKKYTDDGGYHKLGYKPYKRQKIEQKDGSLFEYGVDPEGYTRRGDLVLAVKPKTLIARDKAKIQARTDAYSNISQRNEADKENLKRAVSDAGGNIQVTSGSDEDSDG